MKTQTAVLLATAIFSLSACNAGAPQAAASPSSETVTATSEVAGGRDGRTTLAVGQTLSIRLPSNATTGYRWQVAETYADTLTPGAPFGDEITDPHAPGVVGVGGNTVWMFEAARPGTATLTFAYGRSWEPNAPPAETATYTITVR